MLPQAPLSSRVLAAIALVGLITELAPAVTTNWNVANSFWPVAVAWDNGVPDAGDTAVIRRGNVSPFVVAVRTFPDNNPINPTINRLIIGTNTVYFAGHPDSTLTVERFGHLIKVGGDMIVGQTATDVAVLNSNITSLSVDDATIGSAAGSHGTLNLNENNDTFNVTQTDKEYDLAVGYNGTGAINISGGADVTVAGDTALGVSSTGVGSIGIEGSGSTWTSPGILYVGTSGAGTLSITAGGSLSDTDGYIGTFATSTSSATVSGAGSIWNNSNDLYVGDVGDATLNITSGGKVMSDSGYIGTFAESTATVAISGTGSNWTSFTGSLYVGNLGHGTLNLTSGGDLLYDTAYIGYQAGSTGAATVTGTGSVWSNTIGIYVGRAGNGSLDINSGGLVIVSGTSYIGDDAGSMGDATVDGAASRWTNTGDLYVGNAGNGSLNVTVGGDVSSDNGYIGDDAGSTGDVTVEGADAVWTNSGDLYVGNAGQGALNITASGDVSSYNGYIGDDAGSLGDATVDGAGSTWTNASALYIGNYGDGTLNIMAGGQVINNASGYIGRESGSTGEVNVDGVGSILTTSSDLWAGFGGTGTLNITGGADVTSLDDGRIGHLEDSTGEVTVDGSGSTWTIVDNLSVGNNDGNGTLYVTHGGQINSGRGTIAEQEVTTGAVAVDGIGSSWSVANTLVVGHEGDATLNITAGGSVSSSNSYIGNVSGSTGEATVDGLGSTWTTSGDLYVGFGGNGTLTVANGGFVDPTNVIVGALGSVHGDGNIVGVVQNGGLVSPGESPGTITIDGDYAQTVGGELLIELASASSYDQLLVTDNATLDGTLTVNSIEGFVPSVGQSFTLLTCDDVDGTFASVVLPSVPNFAFDVIYNAQSVVLSLVPALAGDYNSNGIVDAADYVMWRKIDGTQSGYNSWRAHFGETLGSGADTSADATVPEPATLVMLIVASAGILLRAGARECREVVSV